MTRRRLSLDVSYHTIPQPPVAANPVILSPEEAYQYDDSQLELDESIELPTVPVPQDVPATIWWAYFALGAVMLLGWNVIINSLPYFLKRLDGSRMQKTFSFYLTTSSTLVNFIVLWYATVTSNQQSASLRILLSIFAVGVLMLLLTLSTLFHLPPALLAFFVLLNTVLQAAAAAFLQTAVLAIAALFGSPAVQAVLSGQAGVGVAVSVVQFISTSISVRKRRLEPSTALSLSRPESEDRGATVFFGIATLFVGVSLVAQISIMRTRQYKAIAAKRRGSAADGTEETTPLVEDLTASRTSFGLREPVGGLTAAEMLSLNKVYNFSVAFVFIVTLSVFPPITTSITSVSTNPDSMWAQPLFFHSVHFLMFNIGDLIGRFMPSYRPFFVSSPSVLMTHSISRVLFVPLFLLCKITPNSHPFFNSDILFFLLVLLLGLSNGFTSCSIMICSSSLELNPLLKGRRVDVDTAATVASFSLVLGLVLGSFMSFGVRAAVCGGCNPFFG